MPVPLPFAYSLVLHSRSAAANSWDCGRCLHLTTARFTPGRGHPFGDMNLPDRGACKNKTTLRKLLRRVALFASVNAPRYWLRDITVAVLSSLK